MQLEIVISRDVNLLVPMLHDADEDDARITSAIEDAANTTYVAFLEGECVGSALVCWQTDESEIIYLAVQSAHRGKGYGKALIAALVTIARQYPTQTLLVGTANTSVDNILFYQKCGFRMESIRKDYFSYFQTPIYEYGIRIQDMLVFRYDLVPRR